MQAQTKEVASRAAADERAAAAEKARLQSAARAAQQEVLQQRDTIATLEQKVC